MKFVFYVSDGKFNEISLANGWEIGCRKTRDEITVVSNTTPEPLGADVAVMIGLKSIAFREKCLAAGQRVLTFDKGYNRRKDWWRVSIDEHQPTNYLVRMPRPPARMTAAGWQVNKWREESSTTPVIIAGGGRKYYNAFNLPEPVDYVGEIVAAIRAAGCKRRIWYRPKPSMTDVMPVADTMLSRHKSIYEILEGAHALITFGSNACFEAMLIGVPSIVLGDAPARPISSTSLADINDPFMCEDVERFRLLSSLAHCQFTLREVQEGIAINEIKTQLREVVYRDARHKT